jgi:hypothetical protein
MFIIFKENITYYQKKKYEEENIEKHTVYIVRGLKGSGKSSWILKNENQINEDYPIAYNSDNFVECDFFYFMTNKTNLPKNHEYLKCYTKMVNKYINHLYSAKHRIYLTAPFPESWEYSNFVYIAEQYGYNVKFVEITCDTEEHAKYFQFRSPHKNISYLNNIYTYKHVWKNDKRFTKISADISECPGDSLPFPIYTTDELDEQLDNYFKNH